MSPRHRWLRALCALFAPALAASGCAEAEPEADTWAYELADELMSPYCPGRALSECPSPQAEELRAWIVHQEEQGATRAETEAQLYARFGDQLHQAPRAEGMGILAYAIPVVVGVLGLVLVAVFFAHVRRRRAGEEPAWEDEELPP